MKKILTICLLLLSQQVHAEQAVTAFIKANFDL